MMTDEPDDIVDVFDEAEPDAVGVPTASAPDRSERSATTGEGSAGAPGSERSEPQAISDEPDASEASLEEQIDSEIVQLATERDQFKDIAQRLQADFENYRKRVHAQLAAETDRAT